MWAYISQQGYVEGTDAEAAVGVGPWDMGFLLWTKVSVIGHTGGLVILSSLKGTPACAQNVVIIATSRRFSFKGEHSLNSTISVQMYLAISTIVGIIITYINYASASLSYFFDPLGEIL